MSATRTDTVSLVADVLRLEQTVAAKQREIDALHRRCEALRAERDRAQRANRRRDWLGAMAALCDRLARRGR